MYNAKKKNMFSQQSVTNLFAPTLDKRYCVIFYALTVFQFFFIALAIVALFFLLGDMKKNQMLIGSYIVGIAGMFFNYIYSRVLYTMCAKSL